MNDYEVLSEFLVENIYSKVKSKKLVEDLLKNLSAYEPKYKHQFLSCIMQECYNLNQNRARTFLTNLNYFFNKHYLNGYVHDLFSKDEELATNFVGATVHLVALSGSTRDREKIYKDFVEIFNVVEEKSKLLELAERVLNSKLLSEAGRKVESFKSNYL